MLNIAASLLGLHCLSKYSQHVLSKESKRDDGASVAVNMHPFIVSDIDAYLLFTCKVRSELPTRSMKKSSLVLRDMCVVTSATGTM